MVRAGDEDTTTMSMALFWCLCCLIWTCFALPSAVSVFGCMHLWGIICCKYILLHFSQQLWFWLILSHSLIGFMNKILQKEQCESSVDSFNAKIRHFKNFLRFYIYSSFDFEFIFKYYILSHKFYFSQNVETDSSGKFLFYFCIIDAG